MNLVELVKSQLGGDTISRLGSMLGTPPDQTRSAVNAAVPTILAGLGQLASTPDGARRLDAAVENADEGIVGNVSQALSSGGQSLAASGSGLLGSLFGNNMLSGIGSALSRFTGLGGSTITTLLGSLFPAILGLLKGKKQEMGLDAGGLSRMLGSQQQNIANAMPSGLGSLLGSVPGLGALSGAAGRAGDAAHTAVRQGAAAATAGASSVMRWALPAIAVLALAFLLWAFLKNREPAPTVGPTVRTIPQAPEATLAAGQIAADQVATAREQVTGFFKSTTETFNGITDSVSAEAALPKLRELSSKFDTLRTTVNALPADARSGVNSLYESSLRTLRPAIDKVMAIPGVSDKIKPVVDELLRKADALVPR